MKKCLLMFGLLLVVIFLASISKRAEGERLKEHIVLEAVDDSGLLTNR